MDQMETQAKRRNPLVAALCCVVFLALAAGGFLYANYAFGYKGTIQNVGAYRAFYDVPDDSVDVMYVGTSASSRFYVNPQAFHDYGIASFTLGIQNTPSFLLDNVVDEAAAHQRSKVYVVECRPFLRADRLAESRCRYTLDSVSLFSPNRYKMIEESLERMEEKLDPEEFSPNLLDYVFPVVKYHDRLQQGDITLDDLLLDRPYNQMKGFVASGPTLTTAPQEDAVFTDEVEPLEADMIRDLDDLIARCKKLDGQVLFVLSPQVTTEAKAKELNGVEEHLRARGMECLNFNTQDMFDAVGLDCKTDFYNKNHCNYLGAEKYTAWLSQYLKSHYDLPDRRGDALYQDYEDSYRLYKGYTAKGITVTAQGQVSDD